MTLYIEMNIFNVKEILGFIIIYALVLVYIPYYLYFNAHSTIFLTYFSNVDIVANILSINFPKYFSSIYNIDPTGIYQYISYNIISLVALSGIFINGLGLKNNNHSDVSILVTMIIMSIITWTLPTQLIPYLEKKFKQYYNITDKVYDVIITTIISLIFIVIESILIYNFVDIDPLFQNNKYIKNIKFNF